MASNRWHIACFKYWKSASGKSRKVVKEVEAAVQIAGVEEMGPCFNESESGAGHLCHAGDPSRSF
jgi:hypothetical protein